MTDEITEAARSLAAAEHAHPGDPQAWMANIFAAAEQYVVAVAAARDRQDEARRAARRTPEARARRSDAARAGWKAHRSREAGWAPDLPPGPYCDDLTHNGVGSETTCHLPPHSSGDHDDLFGHEWPYEED